MRRHASEIISRMTMVAILSALGTILMLILKFPYPIAPWLMFDFSDTVVLVGYALYGFPGAVSVAVIKTLFNFMIEPSGIYGIGQVSALIASLSYVGCLYLFSHVLHWFRKGVKYRIISYFLISVMVSILMTLLNILFITPTYMVGYYTTFLNDEALSAVIGLFPDIGTSYILIMLAVYIPFNLLKALMITTLYEILFNRLIFVMFKDNRFVQKYFMGSTFKKSENSLESVKNESKENKTKIIVEKSKKDERISDDSKALNDLLHKEDKDKDSKK